jgi:UDPglucose 6-dehydrogenase
MKITMIGTGYVGLVTGACFANSGNTVTCTDINQDVIDLLNDGKLPIYEPSLEEMVHKNVDDQRLFFTTDVVESVRQSEVVFICVGTPSDAEGRVDLSYVLSSVNQIAEGITDDTLVVTKSTVPVGTTEKVRDRLTEELKGLGKTTRFYVANNPEFLKEGAAVEDFLKPDRIVIGSDSDSATQVLNRLYAPFQRTTKKLISMDIRSSELTKYASNAMLATRISFMNEIANLCDRVNADINLVRLGMGSDPRIGKSFIFPGVGYGGSCFPKDVQGLIHSAADAGLRLRILDSVEEVNREQKTVLAKKVLAYFGPNLNGKTFAVWGLAFKPRTDDMREAPALTIIDILRKAGATIKCHDPVAIPNAQKLLGTEQITYLEDKYACVKDADALLLITEWMEYLTPDLYYLKDLLREPVIFDGRNQWVDEGLREKGFKYWAIGYRTESQALNYRENE